MITLGPLCRVDKGWGKEVGWGGGRGGGGGVLGR